MKMRLSAGLPLRISASVCLNISIVIHGHKASISLPLNEYFRFLWLCKLLIRMLWSIEVMYLLLY